MTLEKKVKPVKEPQKLDEKTFIKTLLDAQSYMYEQVTECYTQINQYQKMLNETHLYKSLGYRVDYYLTDEGDLSYVICDSKIGFKK